MSREAWGDPPERQEPPQLCPVCDSDYHAEDCEFGQEVGKRLAAEREVYRLRADLENTRAEALLAVSAAQAAERQRYAPLMQAVEWLLNDGHMSQEHLARLRAAHEQA